MTWWRNISLSRQGTDRLVGGGLGLMAVISASVVFFILIFVCRGALPALREVGLTRLLTDGRWLPASSREPQYGVTAMLAGSLLVTAGAMLLATPLGLLSALFERFYAPRNLGRWYRRVLELLAGVPSVVFGLWGLMVLVPAINRWHPPGQSLLAATLILGLMVLPTLALTASAALESVPAAYFQAASALGMGRAATILGVALPAARTGIGGGALLAAARAIGETMAVVMVCGNIAQIPGSVFDPVRPVTSTIALEMGYATAAHRSVLFATALLLILMVAGPLGLAAFVKTQQKKRTVRHA